MNSPDRQMFFGKKSPHFDLFSPKVICTRDQALELDSNKKEEFGIISKLLFFIFLF
jgi:hypothetical protein